MYVGPKTLSDINLAEKLPTLYFVSAHKLPFLLWSLPPIREIANCRCFSVVEVIRWIQWMQFNNVIVLENKRPLQRSLTPPPAFPHALSFPLMPSPFGFAASILDGRGDAQEGDGCAKPKKHSGDTESVSTSKTESPSAKKCKAYADAKAYVSTLAELACACGFALF